MAKILIIDTPSDIQDSEQKNLQALLSTSATRTGQADTRKCSGLRTCDGLGRTVLGTVLSQDLPVLPSLSCFLLEPRVLCVSILVSSEILGIFSITPAGIGVNFHVISPIHFVDTEFR